MNYVFCAVIWKKDKDKSVTGVSCIAVSVLDENGDQITRKAFRLSAYEDTKAMLTDMLSVCGDEFVLCVWNGYAVGLIKKILGKNGFCHPYTHIYHIDKLYEVSLENCRDEKRRGEMKAICESRPKHFPNKASAMQEVRWLSSLFPYLDFTLIDKPMSYVGFLNQPLNRYFAFLKGKCFHSRECRMVRDANISGLKPYTYYSNAVAAGYTPCSRCKPVNMDDEIAAEVQKINFEVKEKAKSKKDPSYVQASAPAPHKKGSRPLTVYRSVAHMCGLYKIRFEKRGFDIIISTRTDVWKFNPEDKQNGTISLYVRDGAEYKLSDIKLSDPYEIVREIVRIDENKRRK